MDEYRARPGDEHVEPLFGGLGVESSAHPTETPGTRVEDEPDGSAHGGRAVLQWVVALAALSGLGALLFWAL